MRKWTMAIYMVAMVLTVVLEGCESTESDLDRAIRIAQNYKIKSLESTIPKDMDEVLMKYVQEKEEELEPLTTTVFLEKQMTGRYIAHGPQIALIKQREVKVTGLELTERVRNDAQIDFDYHGSLTYGEESLGLTGTLTVLRSGGGWIVNNDVYNMEDLLDIIGSDS